MVFSCLKFTPETKAFFSALPLSICTVCFPKKNNFRIWLRKTLCKSAITSILKTFNSFESFQSPKIPLCLFFTSAGKTVTLGKSRKNGAKNSRVKTVIFTSGYFLIKARKTGTVIATSPIADKRITNMCCFGLTI